MEFFCIPKVSKFTSDKSYLKLVRCTFVEVNEGECENISVISQNRSDARKDGLIQSVIGHHAAKLRTQW